MESFYNRLYRITWYDKTESKWRSESYIAHSEEEASIEWIRVDAARMYIKPDYFRIEECDEYGVPIVTFK